MLDSSIKWPGLSERNQTNPSDEDQSQDSQYASSDFSYEYKYQLKKFPPMQIYENRDRFTDSYTLEEPCTERIYQIRLHIFSMSLLFYVNLSSCDKK